MKSVRNTTAKTQIQALILASTSALSHLEIQTQLAGLCDRVTIYRVLDRLNDEGVVHRVVDVDGVVRYAKCSSCLKEHRHDHVHFSCEKCHTVTCLENVEPSFKLPKNYHVNEVNFILRGTCPKCM